MKVSMASACSPMASTRRTIDSRRQTSRGRDATRLPHTSGRLVLIQRRMYSRMLRRGVVTESCRTTRCGSGTVTTTGEEARIRRGQAAYANLASVIRPYAQADRCGRLPCFLSHSGSDAARYVGGPFDSRLLRLKETQATLNTFYGTLGRPASRSEVVTLHA